MKKIILSLVLIVPSLFGVKKELQNPDLTIRTGKLMIINDNDANFPLSIFINKGTPTPSYRQLKTNEATVFETDEKSQRIVLELRLFTETKIVVLEGKSLKSDPITPVNISQLYQEN